MKQFENAVISEDESPSGHGFRGSNPVGSVPAADPRPFDPSQSRSKPTASGRTEVHFASRTDEWATPLDLFEHLNKQFRFTLDPCSTHENAKCRRHFTRAEDGLIQDWSREVVFMNPPYGREIGHWMRKAYESARLGATVVCLVPARTHTRCMGKVSISKGA